MLRIKFERQNKQLSQYGVGQVTHIPQQNLSAIERGDLKPSPKQLERLSVFFGVKGDDLLKDVAVLGPSR